jgi:hypothetical protein
MAFGDVLQSGHNEGGAAASVTLAAATTGNLLLAAFASNDGPGGDTPPTGFTIVRANDGPVTALDDQFRLYYKISTGGETTITWNSGGAGFTVLHCMEIVGPFSATPLDVSQITAPANQTNVSTGTTPTSVGGSQFAIAAIGARSSTSMASWTNSFIERIDSISASVHLGTATKLLSGAGAGIETTATLNAAHDSTGCIGVFTAVAATPTLWAQGML